MEWYWYVLLVFVGMGGGFVQRVSGFGLGIFVMLFLPHFLPNHTAAAAVSCLFACCTATYNAVRYRKHIAFKTALPMMAAAAVSIPIAVRFSARVSAEVFSYLLGGVLIILSIYFLFFNKKIKFKPTVAGGVLSGTLGGILGGLFSTGGPPVVLYLTQATTDKMVYFATIQFYFCFSNLYATANRAINGILTKEIFILSAIGIIGCMLGDTLGRMVFNKLNSEMVKKVIYIGMIISGILMFI